MKTLGHLRIAEVRLQPGQEWLDAAAEWLFLLVARGAAYWLGEPRPRALAEGELLVIPPAAKGVIRASQINEVVLQGFGFARDMLWGVLSLEERHRFEQGQGKRGELQFLPSTHPAAQRLAALVAESGRPGDLAQRAEALGIVAAVFEDHVPSNRPLVAPGPAAHNRFETVIAQMPDAEIINHTASELAALCGCSSRHFNRLFRRQFGASVRARQAELRLLKASHLLGTTHQKIAEVALASGYRNLSLFNSLFKRRFGMAPSQWRQQTASLPPLGDPSG